jgi:hypothetical protein
MEMTELLDSKANMNISLKQILHPMHTISFAIGNITILS